MPYQHNTASILQAAGYDPLVDFEAELSGGDLKLTWLHNDPQPSEAQVAAWGDDSQALPSGQTFTDYTTVPKEVTPYQLRRALSSVPADRAAVNGLLSGASEAIVDAWESARTIKIDDPLILGAANNLGWDQAKINTIFTTAATFD